MAPGTNPVAPKIPTVSVARLRELFSYDPKTGVITNRIGRPNARVGERAGTVTAHGYRRISADSENLRAHRIAWAMHHGAWPDFIIDHINQDKSDDRADNLRPATSSLNCHNRKPLPNKHGLPGVAKTKKRYWACIGVNGKSRYLGSFKTAEEAHRAYFAAKEEILHTK